MPRAQFGDARRVDIEADDRRAGARKGDRDRQADIAEPDDRDFASVWQNSSLESLVAAILYPLDQAGGNRECFISKPVL